MNYTAVIVTDTGNYLMHHGIKGQKWGVRRYQNEDGSLKSDGKNRYNSNSSKISRTAKTAAIITGGTALTAAAILASYGAYRYHDIVKSANLSKVSPEQRKMLFTILKNNMHNNMLKKKASKNLVKKPSIPNNYFEYVAPEFRAEYIKLKGMK